MFKQINQQTISETEKVKKRREEVEQELAVNLKNIGYFSQNPEKIVGRNCENMIGVAQIPLGVAGPILINGKNHYMPLATTEGALVASVNRGAKASQKAGGILAKVKHVGITRGPVFKTSGLNSSFQFVEWIHQHEKEIGRLAKSTSRHLKLLKINDQIVGNHVFLRFQFDSEDAMGMNMVTVATSAVCAHITSSLRKNDSLKAVNLISLSGNYCVDKKPSFLNFLNGRGKQVWAEILMKEKEVQEVLHVSSSKIVEVVQTKCLLGSVVSGSMGYNAHYANIVAAIFLSCGQDVAHVTEGSLGITSAEVEKNGDLRFSIYLPDLICGTVGGGTGLATQGEALKLMGVKSAMEFAESVAGAVLAGELSLIASLAEGTLARAHEKLGRGKQ